MKDGNPFVDLLNSDPYGGAWVPVGMLGGLGGPNQNAVLFPAGNSDVILSSSDWPLRFGDARPDVYWDENGQIHGSLSPERFRSEVAIDPFLVAFNPPTRPGW